MAEVAKVKRAGSSDKVVLTGRASYPNLDTPGEYQGKKLDYYGVTLLVPKEDKETLRSLQRITLQAARKYWGEGISLKDKDLRTPWKDGATRDQPDYYILNLKRRIQFGKPGIVGPTNKPLPEGITVYGGCWIKASVNAFTYDKTETVIVEDSETGKQNEIQRKVKGVSLSLNNIQFIKDGEPFSGVGGPPENDFEVVKSEDLDDMFKDVEAAEEVEIAPAEVTENEDDLDL